MTLKLMMMGAFVVLGAVFAHEAWTLYQQAVQRLNLANENLAEEDIEAVMKEEEAKSES